ncbi:MAG: S41 family peptidase [Chloroflexota bacterium]
MLSASLDTNIVPRRGATKTLLLGWLILIFFVGACVPQTPDTAGDIVDTTPSAEAHSSRTIYLPHVSVDEEVSAIDLPVATPLVEQTPIDTPVLEAIANPTPLPTTRPRPTQTMTPEPTYTPTPEAMTLEERRAVFTEVWGIIQSNYLYDDFNGVDWDGVYDEYAVRIDDANQDSAFYAEISEMVALLNDQHSRFLPPAAAVDEDQVVSGHDSSVGIGVVTMSASDGALIQLVFPDSPAALAGLRPRDRIIAVDGDPYHYDYGNLEGPQGSLVRLNVLRPGEKPRDVVLERKAVQGRIVPYSRSFPGGIGYIWVSTLWVNDMDEQVNGVLTELVAAGELNGLILDLRGNPGGWRHVLSGVLGHFVRGQVGKFFSQNNEIQPLVVSAPAGPDLRGLPMVVVVDEGTASYAEVMAAILQHEAGAYVVGTSSAGNTETIYTHALSDGSRLWLAQEGFRLQNDVNLEGVGVQPDVVIDVNWKHYSEEDDPQLLEALHLLGGGPK